MKKIIYFNHEWEREIREALKAMGLIKGEERLNTKTGQLIIEFLEETKEE